MDARIRARRLEVQRLEARRRRRRAFSVAALVLAVAGGLAAMRSPLFDIADIRVVGVTGEHAQQVADTAGIVTGDNLLLIDLDTAAAHVEALPWVREATIHRVLPSAVEIRAAPREPAAVVALGDSAWLVDPEGVVLAGGWREGLPVIGAPASVLPPVGVQASDAAVRNALAVHAQLPGPLLMLVARYDAPSARGLRLYLVEPADTTHGLWVRFGLAERIDAKARSIGMLLEHAREQAQRTTGMTEVGFDQFGIAEIDVRAPDNPVLIPAAQ